MIRSRKEVQIGPVIPLGLGPVGHFEVVVAGGKASVIAHCYPNLNLNASEKISLCEITEHQLHDTTLAVGADPSIIVEHDATAFSYVVRPFGGDRHQIFLGKVEHNAPLIKCVKENVEALAYAPILHRANERLALTYVSDAGRTINTLFFSEHAENPFFIEHEIRIQIDVPHRVDNVIIRNANEHCILTFLAGFRIYIYFLADKNWKRLFELEQRLFGSPPARFDAMSIQGRLLFAVDLPDSWCTLQTVSLDLSSLQIAKPTPVSIQGKFPSLASNSELVLLAWIGSPAIPIPVLEKTQDTEAIRRKAMTEWLEQKPGALWGPARIGAIDSNGSCVKTYGPVGDADADHDRIVVCLKDDRGLMAWRSFEGEDVDDKINTLFVARLSL